MYYNFIVYILKINNNYNFNFYCNLIILGADKLKCAKILNEKYINCFSGA